MEGRRQPALPPIPGYDVRGLIGRGGFAEVYAAWDPMLKREVALKVLRSELDAPAFRERFRREAEAVAGLRHPHIIPIHAVGEDREFAWFAMPLIHGESLRARLERSSPLPIGEARRIFTEIAEALAAAHRAGLIHRDVKPDNILLEGEERRVVLTDFGIAKALAGGQPPESPERSRDLTETGLIVGTPQYMSPEQAGGERSIDARSDLYSLGVVAYLMLTGELPFPAGSGSAVLMKQLAEAAPPVERRRPACPRELANVVARCLEREPARRWAAAEELIEALQFRGGLPGAEAPEPATEAVPPIDPRAVVRRFRRNALAWLGVSIMAFALDLVDGSVQFAPLVLILGLFVMAGQYAKAWIAGLEWRDLVGRQDGPMGRWADGQSDLSVMMTAVSTSLRDTPVHRVRNDRAAIVRLLAQVPKAERAQLPELVPVLDRLVALVDDLARQDRAIRMELDRPSASAPGGIRPADANTERLDVIHRQTVAVAGSVGRLRTAVERMRSAGTQSAKPAIEQALEEVVTVERR